MDYQQERAHLEYGDLTYLLIKALGKVLVEKCEGCEGCEPCEGLDGGVHVLTSAITDAAHNIAEDEELPINIDKLTSQRVGMGLSAMRLSKKREAGSGKSGWVVSIKELESLGISYGLQLDDLIKGVTFKPSQHSQTSQHSPNGQKPANLYTGDVKMGVL